MNEQVREFIIKATGGALDDKGEPLFKYCEEIVRCRDYKYLSRDTNVFKWCYRLSPEIACEPDGFCAWGERRE